VPACFVYFPYNPENNAKKFSGGDTNGLAAGNCLEEAIMHGLYEVIERDAYIIMQKNKLVMPDINISYEKNNYLRKAFDLIQSAGLKIYIKLISLDIPIPVVNALIVDPSGSGPAFSNGAGCHFDPVTATLRSITEAVNVRIGQLQAMKTCKGKQERDRLFDPFRAKHPTDIGATQVYRGCLPKAKSLVQHMIRKGPYSIDIKDIANNASDDIKTDIERCISKLRALNYDVFVVNLTDNYIAIPVVRCLVPGLQPYNDGCQRWSNRIFELPLKLGLRKKKINIQDLENNKLLI